MTLTNVVPSTRPLPSRPPSPAETLDFYEASILYLERRLAKALAVQAELQGQLDGLRAMFGVAAARRTGTDGHQVVA